MRAWPLEMPRVECEVISETFNVECVEMYGGCLPVVGHTSTRATYTYPHGKLDSLSRCEVICELAHGDMAVFEIAKTSPGNSDLPNLWYEAQRDDGVHGLFLFNRSKHEIGYFEQYSGTDEPETPRVLAPGYHREYEWTEDIQGVPEPWLIVNEIPDAVLLRLDGRECKCLIFEKMILSTAGEPVHLNMAYLSAKGRRILVRRWEGKAGVKQELRNECSVMSYKGHSWRQHYDVVGDVFLNDGETA